MHELSLAREVIRIVHAAVAPEQLDRVVGIQLRVGKSSGVAPDSLRIGLEALLSGTPLHGVTVALDLIPYQVHCRRCRLDSSPLFGMCRCDYCGTTDTEIVGGTDLEIASIELDEAGDGNHYSQAETSGSKRDDR